MANETFKQGIKAKGKGFIYTSQEDELILNLIKSYPDNIKEAFRQAKVILKIRTIGSIRQRYYNFLKKTNKVLTVGSKKGFTKNNVKNRQNNSKGQSIPLVSNLTHFQQILVDILQLNAEEKQKLKTFIDTIL